VAIFNLSTGENIIYISVGTGELCYIFGLGYGASRKRLVIFLIIESVRTLRVNAQSKFD